MAKLLASEASLEAANTAMTTMGGYGMATAFDVERKLKRIQVIHRSADSKLHDSE